MSNSKKEKSYITFVLALFLHWSHDPVHSTRVRERKMAYKEMFFVQVYGVDGKNRIVPGRSYACADADGAKVKAKWLAEKSAGVVAFSQMVDNEAGDAEEPVLLAHYGRVPPEARAA